MNSDNTNQHHQLLQVKFVRILEELNGLSANDIAVLMTNVHKTIREQGKVSLLNIEAEKFNPDLHASRSHS